MGLKDSFAQFDTDGSGKLSKDEFKAILMRPGADSAFTEEDGPLENNYPNLRNPFDHEVFTADAILRTKHDPFGGFRITSVDALNVPTETFVVSCSLFSGG